MTHKLTHSVVLSTEQIVLLEEILQQVEEEKGIKHQVKIIRLIESALGVCQSEQIALSSKRIKCLALGSVDYVLDIDAELTQEEFELFCARSHLVNISRAVGIQSPIDVVNKVFLPSMEEVGNVKIIVSAYEDLILKGKAITFGAIVSIYSKKD